MHAKPHAKPTDSPPPAGGFTLVELLVTVSIVALLLAILLPSLKSARGQAKRMVCSSNLRQIGGGIWNYWTEHNGTVPYVESPMTNGTAITDSGPALGFGNPTSTDDQIDPFNRELWPTSLPNVLMPTHLGPEPRVFVCPAAVNGWPRSGPPYRYTYRPASVNQPNGGIAPEGTYFRENFGFLDGRMLRTLRIELTDDPIVNIQLLARRRSTYLRDLISRARGFHGPHRNGINVLDRGLAVEFRNHAQTKADLAAYPGGAGVAF